MDDSPTPPWLVVGIEAPGEADGKGVDVEGPALGPLLVMRAAMKRSMWACCSGVNVDVSAEPRAESRCGADWAAAVAGHDRGVIVNGRGSAGGNAVCDTLPSQNSESRAARWARRRTSNCALSP